MLKLLTPYRALISALALLGLASNGATLVFPELIGRGVDSYTQNEVVSQSIVHNFLAAIVAVAILSSLQSLVQAYTSEKVARDLRKQISDKLSRQSFQFVMSQGADKLLTNLTSDVDAIKLFVSQAIAGLLASVVILAGGSVMLLKLNPKLGLSVLSIVPVIGLTFALVLMKVRVLFKESREVVDRLNKVINESIVGAALIRVLNKMADEMKRFDSANSRSLEVNLSIVRHFAMMLPIVMFTASMGTLIILVLGGKYVLSQQMTIGDLTAFVSYLGLLIFPIFMIGFMFGIIARARAAWERVHEVLEASDPALSGTVDAPLNGLVEAKELSLTLDENRVLRDITFTLCPGTRNAIIGPTAAGKTQLLYLMTGLTQPDSGMLTYDGRYAPIDLKHQISMVFQESALFHTTLRENIAFHPDVTQEGFDRAVKTAELQDFVETLPEGIETVVSERGTSLSGGQKQRVMLARALAVNPDVLLLDDFTARLD
ncbi:MAG: ABC transporter ATP-binding protein, partial [Candidatus Eremiobacteraeota bacterium]|nr:ABC transporter ATP-binding protein [Candidatus Eremiobacteraeota bacterium]